MSAKPNDGSTPPDFDSLTHAYAKFRSGYPPQLFARILDAAPAGPLRILDLAAGTGLSAEGLASRAARLVACDIGRVMLGANPARDRVLGKAERLPFRAASFDLVACAQAFHWMEPLPSYAEMHRVLRPGGLCAIWWKYEEAGDPTSQLSDAVVRRVLQAEPPHTDMAREERLPRIAESAFGGADEVRLHHAVRFTADSYLGYQASRENLRRAAGPLRDRVLEELERALRAAHGDAAFDVMHLDRLCLLRKR
ncbi:MAG: class I SAM-dependent methyltransferase [Halobacteriales archaeon]|nr:class I SAM-dependent methyltransferase [Halobacteriales archaeon]